MTLPHGLPYTFEILNRGKKSMVVDLTKEEGRQIVYSLVAKSNAFVQNFRYGVAQRLGVDYQTLQKYNASLVYAGASGFGRKGKQATQTAMDPAIHAASGMMLGIGEPDMPPIHLPGAMSDQITGIMLAYGLMVGLFYQARTGLGREVHTSMLGTMVWVQTNNILQTILGKEPRAKHPRAKAQNPLVNHYRCQDGGWILFAMFQADRYWPRLCRALGLEALIDDPRFNSLTAREQNSGELVSILDSIFATRKRDEWLDILSSEDLISRTTGR
jgi:crotonobetainyl-CoA:carnitine CoA-transferase CaiB-like acyl-CoA transferase